MMKNKGEWISVGDWILVCPFCDGEVEDNDTGEYFNYCPHCGKSMKKDRKDDERE